MAGLDAPSPRLIRARAAAISGLLATTLVLGTLVIGAFLATTLHHRARPKVTLRADWLTPAQSTERGFDETGERR